MTENVAKDIVGIAGAGLAAHYATEMAAGHPRDPNMKGGLMPAPASIGDPVHDFSMQAGRFAGAWGIAHWILLPVWKVYAVLTGFGLYEMLHPSTAGVAFYVGVAVWLALQGLFLWFWSGVIDGRRDKDYRQRRRAMRRASRRNRSSWATTEIIEGHVVLMPSTPPPARQRTALNA